MKNIQKVMKKLGKFPNFFERFCLNNVVVSGITKNIDITKQIPNFVI